MTKSLYHLHAMRSLTCACNFRACASSWTGALENKVPEITIYFWIIKVLATTVGESAADFLNENVGLGLGYTTLIMACVFLVALAVQFAATKYVPFLYWLVVVLISVVGTLITDNLTDNLGVKLWITIVIFGCALGATFGGWYASEKTLSIHSIFTRKREGWYWLTVLFTFALGTAVGDQISEGLALGYWQALVIFAAAIAAVALVYYVLKINAVFAFWTAYVLTRPLGASMGDLLSQPEADKGFGFGAGITSGIFLGLILLTVVYLTASKRDVIPVTDAAAAPTAGPAAVSPV
jgi:uncharacterized membrane-anchored protein